LKSKRIVIISIVVLLAAAIILWLINDSSINREGAGTVIAFTEGGEVVFEADLEYMKSLESEKLNVVIRSSGSKPVEAEYIGVRLMSVLDEKYISWSDKKQVLVKGIDGYVTALSVEELEKKDIYITYEMNGQPLKSKEKNGSGPYQLVIPDDPYSQRWCKFVCEVEVK